MWVTFGTPIKVINGHNVRFLIENIFMAQA